MVHTGHNRSVGTAMLRRSARPWATPAYPQDSTTASGRSKHAIAEHRREVDLGPQHPPTAISCGAPWFWIPNVDHELGCRRVAA